MGGGGVDEDEAGDLPGILRGVRPHVQAAEGMPGQHVRTRDVCAVQQPVEIGRDLRTIGRTRGRITPATPRPVVHAHSAVAGHGGRDQPHRRRGAAATGLQDHGRAAGAGALQVESVRSHVHELTAHGDRGCGRSTDRLVPSAEGEEHQDDQHRVQQPRPGPAVQLAPGAGPDPDHQDHQGRRPDPPERIHHGVRGHEHQRPGQRHEDRRHHRPALRLVGEPRGQHRQERPAQGEAEQHHRGGEVHVHRADREEREDHRRREPRGERPGHDRADVRAP